MKKNELQNRLVKPDQEVLNRRINFLREIEQMVVMVQDDGSTDVYIAKDVSSSKLHLMDYNGKADEFISTNNLLPCPFCKGTAKIKIQKVQYGISGTIIRCKKCGCTIHQMDSQSIFTPEGLKNIEIENHTELAIQKWNTRV